MLDSRNTSIDNPGLERGRVPSLDGLRALAILIVLLAHGCRTVAFFRTRFDRSVLTAGSVGVEIFFVVSGFIITLLLLRELQQNGRVSLKGFYLRRTLRILPAATAFLTVVAVVSHAGHATVSPRDWVAALTYTVNFVRQPAWPIGHLWSLSIEEHFYLLWPACLAFLGIVAARRIAIVAIAICLVLRMVILLAVPQWTQMAELWTFTRLDTIAVGCLTALLAWDDAYRSKLDALVERRGVLAATILGLLLSVLLLSRSGKYAVGPGYTVNALLIAVLLWSVVRQPTSGLGRLLNHPAFVFVGVGSYSLYLWQQLFLDPHGDLPINRFPINLVAAGIAAFLSFWLVERPFLRLKTRLSAAGVSRALFRSDFGATLFNAGCRSGQTIVLNAISVPATAFIIRKLGPTGFGEWSTAAALVTTCTVITNLGLRGLFVRSVAQEPSRAPEALAEQIGTRLVLALIASAIVVVIAAILRYPPVVMVCSALAAAGMVVATGMTTLNDLFEAFRRFPAASVAAFIGGIAVTAATVLAVAVGGGPVALAVAYIVGPAVTLLSLAVILGRERFRIGVTFHPMRAARLIWESRHFAAQQLISALNTNLAILMLPALIGQARFGLFSAGILLVTRLAILPDALGTAFYPMIAKLYADDVKAARRQTLRGLLIAALACAVVAIGGVVFAGPIARILFPKAPDVCRHVILWTVFALPVMGVESIINYALNAAGFEAAQARASVVSAVINLTLGAVIVAVWGMNGACAYMIFRPAIQAAVNLPSFARAFGSMSTTSTDSTALAATASAEECSMSPAVTVP